VTDQEIAEHSTTDEVEHSILQLENLKAQKKEIETEIADIEKYLDKTLDEAHTFEDDEARVTATVVRGYTDTFDDHLISTRYKKIWDAVTKQRIDKALYLDAVRTGLIRPEMHRRFFHRTPKKPYVVVTRRKVGESE
jgi:hypothetical protein